MKLVFGVLSSKNTSEAIEQICRAVGNKHEVVVHHDFSQNPDFDLCCNNAYLIHNFVHTRWGAWSQTEAILKIIEYAHENCEFDYFQLLSDSCLPIRPIGEFEIYLAQNKPDVCMDIIAVNGVDETGMVSYAWRYYAMNPTEQKWLRRLRRLALGWYSSHNIPVSLYEKKAGLSQPPLLRGNIARIFARQLLRVLINASRRQLHPALKNIVCGSTWICFSRDLMTNILSYKNANPEISLHFAANALNSDEAFLHTLICNQPQLKILPLNHYLKWTQRTTGPDELTLDDYDDIMASGKYFARKFSKIPKDPLRRRVMDAIC